MNQSAFNELLEITEQDLRSIAVELRDLIMSVDPDACEVVRLGDRAATYGVGLKKMSEGYCYILPHKSWVNLGFYQGAHLQDPAGLLEGKGKNMRHVKIRSGMDITKPEIKSLVEVAWLERRAKFES